MISKIKGILSDVRVYWKIPMIGRYMTFKEIAAYSGGGIGAYMIITLGNACLLATNNTLLSSTLGVDPTDMYLMYVIAVLANIPLTGIRANIIDNTRNKAGKYRPYIVTMAVPSALICNLMVWFPYNKLPAIVGEGMLFGESRAYVAKCAIIMGLNLALLFIYYFFYDSYENLIHPSFLIYAALAGIFKEIFTFVYFGLFSTDISLWRILINVVIPEYFAYLICVLPAYGAVLGIYCLFKGKDKKRKRDIRH